MANGDGGEFAQYLRGSDGVWTQLTRFEDKVVDAVFGPGRSLYFLYRTGSFVQPPTAYSYDGSGAAEPVKLTMSSTNPADFSDIEIEREFATSRDGTRVPMTILRRRGTRLDGNNPTLLSGYGGYGVSLGPGFDPVSRLWFDRGGIRVIVPEFGTVKDPEQFRALYAYSPYHHVKDGARYPAVLFLTGANDPRVDPMHSRKMAARLQAASGGKSTVLLRTSAGSGHGIGTALAESIDQDVDVYAFLFDQLAMDSRYSSLPR